MLFALSAEQAESSPKIVDIDVWLVCLVHFLSYLTYLGTLFVVSNIEACDLKAISDTVALLYPEVARMENPGQ